jgi:chromosome segregation ATPase
MKRSNYSYYF